MQIFRGFTGRVGRGVYGLFTLLFFVLPLALAVLHDSRAIDEVLSSPWTVLGRALDDLIEFGLTELTTPVGWTRE